jgi:hypothetical protein
MVLDKEKKEGGGEDSMIATLQKADGVEGYMLKILL